MQSIDLNTWKRTTHYNFFRRMDFPHYNICLNIDITHFMKKIKEKQLPFYYAMIYAATHVVNQVEELRYRIRGEQVVLHDKVHPVFSDLLEGEDYFKMVAVDMEDSIEDFVFRAEEKSKKQKDYFPMEELAGRDEMIFITCIPWGAFTSLSHTMSFEKDNSIPRIAWGKFFKDKDKVMLPFSVEVHHSFADGSHVGRYIDRLQDYLNTFE
ncbi:MAG: chloramphenicol acetyltransferase [Firmicutes bacterium]|nr:chloramphenicol acetyltransferase [Bacillota bacterium]